MGQLDQVVVGARPKPRSFSGSGARPLSTITGSSGDPEAQQEQSGSRVGSSSSQTTTVASSSISGKHELLSAGRLELSPVAAAAG
ncbi:MAG: hypothetical protein ACXWFH_12265 [Solirubrobacterales bacterium]